MTSLVTKMAPSTLGENVHSASHGLMKHDIQAHVKPIIVSLEDEDSDMANLGRSTPTKTENGYHEDSRTPDSMESLDYHDPVVIVGMGK